MNGIVQQGRESWGSKLGVILAVAGSAVGLGNFLRFPGQVAANGGGAFMIPYFIAFLVVGVPICWAEWTLGRYGGSRGYNSVPGIFSAIWSARGSRYVGALGLMIPVMIYMYYVYIESWCLGYAIAFLTGELDLGRNPAVYGAYFSRFTGLEAHGAVFRNGIQPVFWFFLATFTANFYFIYRGLSRGIEAFCKFAMPLLILAAMVMAGRVLTLPEQPLPEPWQRALPKALPAAEWAELERLALQPETTPQQLALVVEAAVDRYLARQLETTGGAAAVAVVPTAGFGKTPGGYAVAMAELRAGEAAAEYRNWIHGSGSSLTLETRLRLRSLEQEQLGGDPAKLVQIEEERAALLAGAGDGPLARLLPYLQGVRGIEEIGDPASLLRRAAANELSELPRTVRNGLGYMWNPDFRRLRDPSVWLAATGQIFFSLSVGFGVILTYASYLRHKDDVVLSGLTASATNEFCEVCLGGLVAIPATFIFLGTAATLEAVSGSTFGLGFNTLPSVFASMPGGRWFGAIWFGLLFLAAITSSLSMLQPAIAFLEEGFGLKRRASVAALGLLTMTGALFVIYFSGGAAALGTMDDWVGTVAIYLLATLEVLVFGWVIGVDRGLEEAQRGADLRIPRFFRWVLKYVTPGFLLVILGAWMVRSLPAKVAAIGGQPEVLLTVLYLLVALVFLVLLVHLASENWQKQEVSHAREHNE